MITRPPNSSPNAAIASGVVAGGGPSWSPTSLFAAGEVGAWYDPSDLATLFQDSAGTTPVTTTGQPVGKMLDKSGRGNHATQATAASQPTLQQDAGGRYYLSFDGVNDFLVTGSIDFSGTDKMTLWAGVYKASDAARATVLELSASVSGNNGSFAMEAPDGAAATTYLVRSKGTAESNQQATPFAAPHTAVLTGMFDIAGDTASIRVNGVAFGPKTTDQGAGNYGNYPLYIGRRGGTTQQLNGRIYGLIVRGAFSTAAQIGSAERFLAGKSGASL